MNEQQSSHQMDFKSANFDRESYLSDLLRKKSLDELVQVEVDMVHHVRRLDSEMQQLVYENYNKFLTATSTVKKMQNDFNQMGCTMESLTERMGKIAELSKDISNAFGKHRTDVSELAAANKKVKSLQLLLTLPQKLQAFVEAKKYVEVIKAYQASKPSILRFKDIESVADVYLKTNAIMMTVEEQLREIISTGTISSDEFSESLTLLFNLGVESSIIYTVFLTSCRCNLEKQLDLLTEQKCNSLDVLEFVEKCCETFLTDLSLVTALNHRFFSSQISNMEIIDLIDNLMVRFDKNVKTRFLKESDARDCAIVVRALDRFYRRMSSCNQLSPGVDYLPMCISMLNEVSRHEIELARLCVVESFTASLKQTFDELNTSNSKFSNGTTLSEMITRLQDTLLVQLKTALASLLLFTASDMTFSSLNPSQFSLSFGIDVHECLVAKSLEKISVLINSYCDVEKKMYFSTPNFFIVLAKFLDNVENNSVSYIFDLCQEQFRLTTEFEKNFHSCLKPVKKVQISLRSTAYNLLKHYVYLQGLELSQSLVRSVENRDWFGCTEPTNVRTAVKFFINDLSAIDSAIKPFMTEGRRKERVVDVGLTRSHIRKGNNFETCSISSTLDKLWSERIDLCANVEFNRISILTSLAIVTLKSFLEVIRMQTFSQFGLQQIQVDCCFLQQNMWRYLSDEQVALSLIDEITLSAIHRSVDAKLMEPLEVKKICG